MGCNSSKIRSTVQARRCKAEKRMGCNSSKLPSAVDPHDFSGDLNSITATTNCGDLPNHTVTLNSSTYGVLNLDPFESQNFHFHSSKPLLPTAIPKSKNLSFSNTSPEIINWILADDPEDAGFPKRSKSPLAFLTPSPKKYEKIIGKENRTPCVPKPLFFSENKKSGSKRSISPLIVRDLVVSFKREVHSEAEKINQMVSLKKRTNFLLSLEEKCPPGEEKAVALHKKYDSPLFYPDLVAAFERDLLAEKNKEMISLNNREEEAVLSFEEKCQSGGEKEVVLYTTTLSCIRKTYQDCNLVRSIMEYHNVLVIEKDISMDLGFREELQKLMGGSKEVKLPVLFVKGRMVGGADEVLKLVEGKKMEILMAGIPKAARNCGECENLRFVICKECSRKVLDEGEKKKVKRGLCNENGLV